MISRLLALPLSQDIFEVGDEGMGLTDLAKRLAVPSGELLKTLFMKGIMSTVNSTLDKETVKAIALVRRRAARG